jgi:hypothetical protein
MKERLNARLKTEVAVPRWIKQRTVYRRWQCSVICPYVGLAAKRLDEASPKTLGQMPEAMPGTTVPISPVVLEILRAR